MIEHCHYFVAVAIARVFLGFLFLFQGYDAAVRIGLQKVTDTYQERFAGIGIPRPLTFLAAMYTSYTEFILGILLIFGWFQFPALYLLGLNLVIAGIGFGMNEPLWNTRHVFTRLVLLLFLLIVPMEWHRFSLDYLLFK